MPPGMALIVTLRGSNYCCLEQIFNVPKGFEPSKFDCNSMLSVLIKIDPIRRLMSAHNKHIYAKSSLKCPCIYVFLKLSEELLVD